MHQVTEYFSRAVTLFKDDTVFMSEFTKLLQTAMPLGLRHDLVMLYSDELEEANMVTKETSQSLQLKCTLLYLLGLLSVPDEGLSHSLMKTITLPLMQSLSFQSRFPIHEKYHSVLYLCLYWQLQQVSSSEQYENLEAGVKTRVF